ncbi:cobalamin biosynthesis protein [Streptomyces hebeiensis]
MVGIGARRGVSAEDVSALVAATLRGAGLPPLAVVELATVAAKAAEPGILGAAERLGVPVRGYAAELLAGVRVPHPSDAALAAVGTHSVAEAAALVGGGVLLVPKRTARSGGGPGTVTCAVACRGHPEGDPEWNRSVWT